MIQNVEKNEPMSLMSEFESLRTTEEFYHPLDAGNFTLRLFMGKTHVNMQRTHRAQKSEGFKTIRID